MSEEARRTKQLGPQLFVENGSDQSSDFGPEAFGIKGTNDDGRRFLLAHHQSENTRLETEANLLIQCASKSNKNATGLNVISHGGDIMVNSPNRSIKVGASDEIVLEANKIILKANKIQIGDSQIHGTREITLNATRIQVDGKKGNLPNFLKISNGAKIAFGPGGFVGASIANKFFNK